VKGGGRHFRDNEVARFEVGQHAKKGPFLGPRGGIEGGKNRKLSGLQRTPMSTREHPNVKADFRVVRALIERQNGVLRRFWFTFDRAGLEGDCRVSGLHVGAQPGAVLDQQHVAVAST
jgi:hypothetical protein